MTARKQPSVVFGTSVCWINSLDDAHWSCGHVTSQPSWKSVVLQMRCLGVEVWVKLLPMRGTVMGQAIVMSWQLVLGGRALVRGTS